MILSARKAGVHGCFPRFCTRYAFLLLSSVLFLTAAQPAGGRTLYVDPVNGDDVNTGDTELDALKTLTHTFQVAFSGDTVIALPGTYSLAANRETFPLVLPAGVAVKSRDGAAATVIQDDDDNDNPADESTIRIILDAAHDHDQTRLEGFTIDGKKLQHNLNGISIESSGAMTGTSPTITRCTIVNYEYVQGLDYDQAGISLTVSSNSLLGPSRITARIDGNTITGSDNAIWIYADTGGSSNPAVEASEVYNNVIYDDNYGIVLIGNPAGPATSACSVESKIYHNTIVDMLVDEACGIELFGWSPSPTSMVPATLVNNILAVNLTPTLNRGYGICEDTGSSDPRLVDSNDFFMNERGLYLDENSTALTTIDEVNALPEAGQRQNFDGNPAFVSTMSHDYHIQGISPCVGKADSNYMPPDDMDGQVRPFPVGGLADVGADEYVPVTNLIRDHVDQIRPFPSPPLSTILPLVEPCASPTCEITPSFQSGDPDPEILYDPGKPLVFYRISPGTGVDIAFIKDPADGTVRIDFR